GGGVRVWGGASRDGGGGWGGGGKRGWKTPALAAAGSPAPADSSLHGRGNRPDSRAAMRPAKAGAAEPPAEQGRSCAARRRRLCLGPAAPAMPEDACSPRRG